MGHVQQYKGVGIQGALSHRVFKHFNIFMILSYQNFLAKVLLSSSKSREMKWFSSPDTDLSTSWQWENMFLGVELAGVTLQKQDSQAH